MRRDRLRWLTARPIAHRGLHDLLRDRPENSLAAFNAAMQQRYAIECDVHLSADGVPMVFHDDELERMTGARGRVCDRSASELGALRLAGTAEQVPTLVELLDLVEGRVPIVIELKQVSGGNGGLARSVADQLRHYDGPVALMSFDSALIAELKAYAPQLVRGLTAFGNWRDASAQIKTVLRLRVSFVSYAIDDLPTPAPILARNVLGIPLICWTVRTREQLAKARTWTDQITFEGFAP